MIDNRGTDKVVFRVHAIQRMFERGISEDEVRHVLSTGEIVEDYPDDYPYPSQLLLGWCSNRPVHVVVAHNVDDGAAIIVTVYEPDRALWQPGFKRRRQ
ncbi:MAG: DUF4258 domain-containing protein [Armatimonadetes bacterium]|nr:DUF4258 domain-containing protein [Armatimonadota bacterium]